MTIKAILEQFTNYMICRKIGWYQLKTSPYMLKNVANQYSQEEMTTNILQDQVSLNIHSKAGVFKKIITEIPF